MKRFKQFIIESGEPKWSQELTDQGWWKELEDAIKQYKTVVRDPFDGIVNKRIRMKMHPSGGVIYDPKTGRAVTHDAVLDAMDEFHKKYTEILNRPEVGNGRLAAINRLSHADPTISLDHTIPFTDIENAIGLDIALTGKSLGAPVRDHWYGRQPSSVVNPYFGRGRTMVLPNIDREGLFHLRGGIESGQIDPVHLDIMLNVGSSGKTLRIEKWPYEIQQRTSPNDVIDMSKSWAKRVENMGKLSPAELAGAQAFHDFETRFIPDYTISLPYGTLGHPSRDIYTTVGKARAAREAGQATSTMFSKNSPEGLFDSLKVFDLDPSKFSKKYVPSGPSPLALDPSLAQGSKIKQAVGTAKAVGGPILAQVAGTLAAPYVEKAGEETGVIDALAKGIGAVVPNSWLAAGQSPAEEEQEKEKERKELKKLGMKPLPYESLPRFF